MSNVITPKRLNNSYMEMQKYFNNQTLLLYDNSLTRFAATFTVAGCPNWILQGQNLII